MAETERIILGSGNVHMKLFDGNLPSVDEICTDENQISYIQGGATIEYKPTYYTAKDDTRKIQKTVITDEEATLKSGLMTFCGNTLEKICDTARVSYAEKTSTKYMNGLLFSKWLVASLFNPAVIIQCSHRQKLKTWKSTY